MSTPFQGLAHFSGVLILDPPTQQSFLRFHFGMGQVATLLMLLDPIPTGQFSPAAVVAAFRQFSAAPGFSGAPLQVQGFVQPPPGGNQPILHVV